jgi:GAF domain-containing protein
VHAVSANRSYKEREIALPVDGNHAGARVWREQKPLVLSPLEEQAAQPGDPIEEALKEGIHALILVPLTNGDRRLGILGFGFTAPFQPDAEALAFLQRVASEVAVSVDGYLARQALLWERDRMRVLFDITNALVSKLPMDDLFSAISEQLNRVVARDFAVVTLLDKATGEIHLKGLHSPGGIEFEPEETSGRPEGLAGGEALATGRPVVTTGVDFARFPSPLYRKYAGTGFRSSCSIPLAGANGMSGVLDLARKSGEPDRRHLHRQMSSVWQAWWPNYGACSILYPALGFTRRWFIEWHTETSSPYCSILCCCAMAATPQTAGTQSGTSKLARSSTLVARTCLKSSSPWSMSNASSVCISLLQSRLLPSTQGDPGSHV